MTLRDLLLKTMVGVNVKVLDYNTGKVLEEATSGYIVGCYQIVLKEVKSVDIEDNVMIIRVK